MVCITCKRVMKDDSATTAPICEYCRNSLINRQKVKVSGFEDAKNMVFILASNGYKTWVEMIKRQDNIYDYYVCWEEK